MIIISMKYCTSYYSSIMESPSSIT